MESESTEGPPRRLLVSGATGLIGRRFVAAQRAAGDVVVPLVRPSGVSARPSPGVPWDPSAGALDPAAVGGFDAVVHLAGEPVNGGRWTADRKARIRDSRLAGTATLAKALAATDRPPAVVVCASGINYYGDRGDAVVDESTPKGSGFLADVCEAWEAAAAGPLAGVCRVVFLRIGAVLSPDGGMLAEMLPVFRWGLGGPVAGGHRYVPWVSARDALRAIDHAVASGHLAGPVNVVAPNPVTNRAFTAALAAAVRRPAVLPVPAWAVRLAAGGIADETVLASLRAVPRRWTDDGFRFRDETIEAALADALGTAWGGR